MSFVGSNILAGASGQGGAGYEIERSLRFNSADSAYLNRTPSSPGNRTTWTWSGWIKRSAFASQQAPFTSTDGATATTAIYFSSTDKLVFYTDRTGVTTVETDGVLRDPSAWYHAVIAVDTTQATSTDRVKIYLNGVQQTLSGTYPAQNFDTEINRSSFSHKIGGLNSSTWLFNGYLADVHFIDGQAFAASDFGAYDANNVWQPKGFAGSYSTADQAGTSSPYVYTNFDTTPNQESNVLYLNSNPDSSSYPLIQSNVSTNNTIRVKFASAQTGVTSIKFRGGGYSSTSTYNLFVNGTQIGGSHGTNSNWAEDSHTISSTDITEIKIVGSDGFAVGQLKFNDTLVSGTPSYGTSGTGLNSFHLNFSDNSSNAALGTDSSGNSNDWTVNNISASAGLTAVSNLAVYGTLQSGNIASAFDGNAQASAVFWGRPNNFGATFDAVTANSSVRVLASSQSGSITINQSINTGLNSAYPTFAWLDVSSSLTFPFTLTAVGYSGGDGGDGGGFSAVEVDGKILATANAVIPYAAGIDSLIDTPTNYEAASGNNGGNYATWNPLAKGSITTLSNGNLDMSSGASWQSVVGTFGATSGKWYWEQTMTTNQYSYTGICNQKFTNVNVLFPGQTVNSWSYLTSNGVAVNDQGGASQVAVTLTTMPSGGGTLGFALDLDNQKLWFALNGTWMGSGSPNPATGTAPTFTNLVSGDTYFPCADVYSSSAVFNFGQRPFAYTPPTGYASLCTTNLPDPTITDGSTAMDVTTWNGDSTYPRSITGLNFSPDFIWLKNRTSAYDHVLMDAVRGTGTTKWLSSNLTDAEGVDYANANVTSLDSNGFTIGSTTGTDILNQSGTATVGWTWDGGTSNTSISAGDLNSSAYDQSQDWSASVTNDRVDYPASNGFDGSLSTIAYAPNTQSTTVTFSSSISVTTLRIYISKVGAGTDGIILNGSTNVASQLGSTGWNTITGVTSLSSITYKSTSGTDYVGIIAVEVNGKILIDTNVTPPNVPSIASTVRANPSAGFSIVTWTTSGTTGDYISVGHGLNALPGLVITKSSSNADSWYTAHGFDLTQFGMLNSTNAFSAAGVAWGGGITSSVIGMRVGNFTANNYTHVAYCFAHVEGYSAFGSYTGNGSNDGAFVYTGFAVRYLLTKPSSSTGDWLIWDTERDPINPNDKTLGADNSSGENSNGYDVDLLSNGFKWRQYGSSANGSNVTYIYAAFAEHPFKTARAR